ncbi:MAG: SpoIID/LytB domain-containing protein [Planctomycetes bacterium]|nr:SpoIID/LytB domain-containing protein [Planctomycetota bacterium]
MSNVARPAISKKKYLSAAALLLWLFFFASCTERQLASPTPQMDTPSQFWIRVLLADEIKTCKLKIDLPFKVIDNQTQSVKASFGKFDSLINTAISNGKINIAGRSFIGSEMVIVPDEPCIFNLNGNDYRGKLKLVLNKDGGSFDAINLVPIEPYLAGVVAAEMPSYWEREALKVQAIISRTYCLYIKKHFGKNRSWDVRKTQANQRYLGIKAESARIWEAVNKTNGQVLVCRQPDGSEDIFPAYYSSACGGHTENSQNVFGGDFYQPLAGVKCPYCKNVSKLNNFFWPMVKFDKKTVTKKLLKRYSKLKELDEIVKIKSAKQSNYGNFSRLTSIELSGSTGKKSFLRAEDLRLSIDPTGQKLKSTICKIVDTGNNWTFQSGRGFGHGVGLCQCGAEEMARKGKNTKQILSFYYPNSKIIKLY